MWSLRLLSQYAHLDLILLQLHSCGNQLRLEILYLTLHSKKSRVDCVIGDFDVSEKQQPIEKFLRLRPIQFGRREKERRWR